MKIDETMEMSYPRKLVEQIILGLGDPINQHLIKLVGFDFPREQRQHFRHAHWRRIDRPGHGSPACALPLAIIM